MSQRERSLFLVVVTVGGFVVLFGGLVTVQRVLGGLSQMDEEIATLQRDVSTKQTELLVLGQQQKKYDQWKAISLPPDLETAKTQYQSFLQQLCRRNQVRVVSPIRPGAAVRSGGGATRTGNFFTPVGYHVQADATLPQLIGFLKEFYSANLPHLIREITVTSTKAQADAPLDVVLKVEALSLPNAPSRDSLIPVPDARTVSLEVVSALQRGPTGVPLALWLVGPTGFHGSKKLAGSVVPGRDYPRLVTKNVFAGLRAPPPPKPPPVQAKADPEVLKFVHLASISSNFLRTEASLRNRATNGKIRLRSEAPFDTFEVKDRNNYVVLKGKVKAIHPRSVDFTVEGKDYRMSMGDTLHQALKSDKVSPEGAKTFNQNAKSEKIP